MFIPSVRTVRWFWKRKHSSVDRLGKMEMVRWVFRHSEVQSAYVTPCLLRRRRSKPQEPIAVIVIEEKRKGEKSRRRVAVCVVIDMESKTTPIERKIDFNYFKLPGSITTCAKGFMLFASDCSLPCLRPKIHLRFTNSFQISTLWSKSTFKPFPQCFVSQLSAAKSRKGFNYKVTSVPSQPSKAWKF